MLSQFNVFSSRIAEEPEGALSFPLFISRDHACPVTSGWIAYYSEIKDVGSR
jgi:hypothetical protein